MSYQFDPSAWTDGSSGTVPTAQDFKDIAADIATRGGNADGAGYGRANTGFLTLIPGARPGTSYNVSAASWAGGVVTLTIGAHTIAVGQRILIASVSPSDYNGDHVVTTKDGTHVTFALASDPGTYSSGGTVLVGGVSAAEGMICADPDGSIKVYKSSTWTAATTAVSAGVWYTGSGVPSDSSGSNGDMYLRSNGDVYGPKTAGAWGSVACSIKGTAGDAGASSVWLSGSGAPSAGTGGNGDMYFDYDTGDIYGPKSGGAWGSSIFNTVGPSGSGLADPGSNCIPKRTGLNTTAPAVAGTDYYAPGGAIARTDLPVFVGAGASHAKGVVPDPGATADDTQFLCINGNFAVPKLGNQTVTLGSSVSIPAGTQATLLTLTLPAGTWLLTATIGIGVGSAAGLLAAVFYNETASAYSTEEAELTTYFYAHQLVLGSIMTTTGASSTIRLYGYATGADVLIRSVNYAHVWGAKATSMRAVRIA